MLIIVIMISRPLDKFSNRFMDMDMDMDMGLACNDSDLIYKDAWNNRSRYQ